MSEPITDNARPAKKQKTSHGDDVSEEGNSSTASTPAPPPLSERIASILPILEAHDVSPGDLILAIVKAERRQPTDDAMQKYRDDLYNEPGNTWSKLSDILEAVTESKKGLKALKRWLRAETAEEIITGIIQGEINGDGDSDEEEE